jgi:predicted RNase H-like HicB family nuclease
MDESFEEKAKRLASLPYTIVVEQDETTDGEPIYVLSHPELPGCIAQGENWEEASENLFDATYEYILSLLEDGLSVPEPRQNQVRNIVDLTTNTYFYSNSPQRSAPYAEQLRTSEEENTESSSLIVDFHHEVIEPFEKKREIVNHRWKTLARVPSRRIVVG